MNSGKRYVRQDPRPLRSTLTIAEPQAAVEEKKWAKTDANKVGFPLWLTRATFFYQTEYEKEILKVDGPKLGRSRSR